MIKARKKETNTYKKKQQQPARTLTELPLFGKTQSISTVVCIIARQRFLN